MSDWFWEGNVQRVVAAYLVTKGWSIETQADTASRARGIDIVAVNDSRRLAVEVKGFPATTYARGPKAGQPKPTSPMLQARHWFAQVLLATLLTRAHHPDYEIAIALPDVPRFRTLLADTDWALARLVIGVYLVTERGDVKLLLDHRRAQRTTTRIVVPAEGVAAWRALLTDPAKQWKSGYSAKALAHCWQQAHGFPQSVQDVFASAGTLFRDAELVLAIPEHRVALPGGSRASHTDLFVLARSGSELMSISVEGKVAEPFDETVRDWLDRRAAEQAKRGRPREPSAQAKRRLAFVSELLRLDDEAALGLRYQLLHRTAAALLEAQRFAAPHALMLVHSFSSSDAWFTDFRAFAQQMGAPTAHPDTIVNVGERAGVNVYLGWVRGEERFVQECS